MENGKHSNIPEGTTVIESRSVKYLLTKLRDQSTKGKVGLKLFQKFIFVQKWSLNFDDCSCEYLNLSVNPFQNFMIYGDRLMRILAEEALCRLPSIGEGSVETPCGMARGLVDKWKLDICLVSVVRSGILHKREWFSTFYWARWGYEFSGFFLSTDTSISPRLRRAEDFPHFFLM